MKHTDFFQPGKNGERIRSTKDQAGLQRPDPARIADAPSFYQQLEMSSPYVNTHRDITYSYEPMSLHSHPFYEIICCRSTCGAEYLIGPYRYSLQKGDILLVRPGTSHCVILPEHLSIPYERDVLWINVGCLYQLLEILGIAPNGEMSTFLLRTAGTPWEYLCSMIHQGVLTFFQIRDF